MYTGFNYEIQSQISTNKSDILKTQGKFKFKRENIVDNNVMHIMTITVMNSYKEISFFIISHIFSFPNSI